MYRVLEPEEDAVSSSSSRMQRMSMSRFILYCIVVSGLVLLMYTWMMPCDTGSKYKMVPKEPVQYTYNEDNQVRLVPCSGG